MPTRRSSKATFFSRTYFHPFAIVGALTGTLWIGNDGAGCDYLVEVSPSSSAVYVYDGSEDTMTQVADSFARFVTLNKGLPAGEDAHALRRTRPRSSLIQRRFARTGWLRRALLQRVHLDRVFASPARGGNAADVAYRLWHAFVMNRVDVVKAVRASRHPSLLVRRTADLLAEPPAECAYLREWRAMFAEPIVKRDEVRRAVLDQQSYACFTAENWREMRTVSLQSVAADPYNYYGWLQLGIANQELGDLDAAFASFERSLALCPTGVDSASAWMNTSAILETWGKRTAARVRRAIAIRYRPEL